MHANGLSGGLLKAVLVLVLALLSLGCIGVSEQAVSYPGGARASPVMAAPPAYDAGGQYIAKQGSISLKVPEGTLQERFDSLRAELSDQGAELSDISYNEYGERKQYSVTIRISPSRFDQVMSLLQTKGEVKDISVRLEDVSKQYVELDVRIKNREAELGRLTALYNQTDDVSQIIEIERELTRVETELELLKQQKQDIVSRVERSTIVITMYEERPAVNRLSVPLEGLAGMFFGAIAAAITLLVLAAGFLIPIAIVVGLLYLAYRKFAVRKGGPKPSEHKKIPPLD